MGVKLYFTGVFTYISLMDNDTEHFLMCLFTICMSLEKCYLSTWVVCLLLLRCKSLYIFWVPNI